MCSGVCVPGSKQCSGKTPQTCDTAGAWANGAVCAFDCAGGNCTTSCTSSSMCSGATPECDTTTGKCVDCIAKNACGGCGALAGTIGAACGSAGCGKWACAADKTAYCSGDVALNLCGGCGALTSGGKPGDSCGTFGCGLYACAADKMSTACQGDVRNSCGGCKELKCEPGALCEEGGRYPGCTECLSENESWCNYKEPKFNECGGCTALKRPPGTACTPSSGKDCGQYVCEKSLEDTACVEACPYCGVCVYPTFGTPYCKGC